LLQQKTLITGQNIWIEKIATFDMEILHKRGKDNIVVDALSQKDEEAQVCVVSIAIRNSGKFKCWNNEQFDTQ
jgi:hypothetical protein